jgi:zinc transport system substrate-binding protein
MVLILLIFKLYGEAREREPASSVAYKPVAAVSIVPQKTLIEAIAGDRVDVVVMIPPGSSPETYEPSPREMENFNRAGVYFTIGVPVEETSILPQAELSRRRIVALHKEAVGQYPDVLFPDGSRDPHIWLSPRRVQVMAEVMAEEMGRLDPAHADLYKEKAREYTAELAALDEELQALFSALPKKKFMVFHPAFGYLAADYGLEMYALEEEGKEARMRSLRTMIDFARAEGIKTIFCSDEHSSRQAEAFAEEIRGKVVVLSPLAEDYIENMREMAALIAGELR